MARKRKPSSRPARPRPVRTAGPAEPEPRRDRVLVGAVLLVLLLLGALGDDRHVGLIADGRQMIRTAVALVETGEIGQARGRDFTHERPAGDGVSRFGMATSLLQVPAAWVAPRFEERLGRGSSQAIFLLVPWIAIGLAAWAAGAVARLLGGTDTQVAAAVLLASLASPLGSYAALEFSEPVQAASLTLALMAALAAARAGVRRSGLEVAAGLAAGFAVLTKTSLIAAAPFALLPLVDPADRRRSARSLLTAGVGASLPLVVWLAFELARFGTVFGGYPDDRFTHPWFDGFWRLLVGPNRGFLLFWPAWLLFVWTGLRYGRAIAWSAPGRAWIGAGLVLVAQLAVAAGYWGWHGMEGWGPRLVLSSVSLMAPFAALAPVPRPALMTVVAASALINVPPLLQHPTPVATYVMNLPWPEVSPSESARYPFYATAGSDAGGTTVIPYARLETVPSANPFRLYPWFWRATALDADALAERLHRPPWAHAHPELVPPVWPPAVAREIAPPRRSGFLGRSLTGSGGPYATVYLDALLDQVIRANQEGRIDRALELSDRRLQLSQDGEAAAWRLESLRRAGWAEQAEALLRSLPEEVRRHPAINVVLALFDREFGEERRARALLGSVADAFPGTPLQAALTSPLSEWPPTLDALTRAIRRDAVVAHDR